MPIDSVQGHAVRLLAALAVLVSAACAGPHVTGSNPADGKGDVPLDRSITVTFSQDMDPATINATTFTVSAPGDEAVGQIAYYERNATFMVAELLPLTEYTVRLSRDIRSSSGDRLEEHSFTFTTGATFADGKLPRPRDFRPLARKRFIPINRLAEYLIIGGKYDNSSSNQLLIDPYPFNPPIDGQSQAAQEVLYRRAEEAWLASQVKVAAAGNVDDDPAEEALVVSWPEAGGPGALRLIDDDGSVRLIGDAATDLLINAAPTAHHVYDVALADVDGDGYAEVLVAGTNDSQVGGNDAPGVLWLFDDSSANFALLRRIEIRGEFDPVAGYQGATTIRVAAGNLDGDRAAEIVIVFGRRALLARPWGAPDVPVSYQVFDDAGADFAELRRDVSAPIAPAGDLAGGTQIAVRVADVDGDRLGEIVIGTLNYNHDGGLLNHLGLHVIDDQPHAWASLHSQRFDYYAPVDARAPLHLEALDLDGDQMAELLLHTLLLDDGPTGSFGQLNPGGSELTRGYLQQSAVVAIGDINGDQRDDLALYGPDGVLRAHGYRAERDGDGHETGVLHWEELDRRAGDGHQGIANQLMVLVDGDRDSTLIEYTGDNQQAEIQASHQVYFSDNRILAVLAAAPCKDEIGQNIDACATGLGTSSGSSTTVGASMSVRAGVLVGCEAEVQAGFISSTTVFSFEAEVSVEMEATGTLSQIASVTKSITDLAGFGEDLVVFSTVPYDRYIYRIASHPVPAQVGRTFVIDIPKSPRVLAVSRDYYNANNGTQLDVDEAILPSTPGNFDSYPTVAEKNELLANHTSWGEIGPVSVNQGSGSKELELEVGQELGYGTEVTMSVDASFKACVVGVCAGASAGFSVGASFENTISTSTVFSSSVGAIDAEHFAANMYEYGLFAYRRSVEDASERRVHDFFVVNYWIQ